MTSDWIPVSDRLPESGQRVLVYCAGKDGGVAKWASIGPDGGGYFIGGPLSHATHWQPLPPPPGEEKR
jgi:hypothetical protein